MIINAIRSLLVAGLAESDQKDIDIECYWFVNKM